MAIRGTVRLLSMLPGLLLFLGCKGEKTPAAEGSGANDVRIIVHREGSRAVIPAPDPRVQQVRAELDSLFAATSDPLFLAIEAAAIDEAKGSAALEIHFPTAQTFMLANGAELKLGHIFIPLGDRPEALAAGDGTLLIAGYPDWSAGPWLSRRSKTRLLELIEQLER